jgi:hypothetical protein
MGSKASAAEKAAYGTGCALASELVQRYPGITEDLRRLIDAARTEQRLACKRGRPIYSREEEAADLQEVREILNRPAGSPGPRLLDVLSAGTRR